MKARVRVGRPINPQICIVCGKPFRTKAILHEHKYEAHGQ